MTLSNQKKKEIFGKMRENDCRDSLKADEKSNFSLECVAASVKNMINGRRDFSERNLGAQKCYVYVAKLIATMTRRINSNLAAKD